MEITKKEQLKYINDSKKRKKWLEKECHKLWRLIVFARANYICEYYSCRQKATQPHHIKTKGHSSHLKYDIDNGLALCYYHHKGKEGAHSDINFKDKILGKYPGYKAIRTQAWMDTLDWKDSKSFKLNLEAEYLFLINEVKKYEIK